jgi:hypothetical protein
LPSHASERQNTERAKRHKPPQTNQPSTSFGPEIAQLSSENEEQRTRNADDQAMTALAALTPARWRGSHTFRAGTVLPSLSLQDFGESRSVKERTGAIRSAEAQ